ncbi:alpha/beta fold hydrolase [Nocardia farcinica]|uniref:alpha/beta fold hydrolase n=1 Tax=Nocardia farcinica TaxID=37329 RepID=UPI002456BDD4|nr:alpha/beta hydrolase [Nocardia farcinica]
MNGTMLNYRLDGRGPVTVVFVHGYTLDLRMWQPQVEALVDQCRMVRYDARGFGKSPLPPDTPYAHADDLLSLMDHLSIPSAVLVGMSMGGRTVLHAALKAPHRVLCAVVAGCLVNGTNWDTQSDNLCELLECLALRRGLDAAKSAWLQHELFSSLRTNPAAAAALAEIVEDYNGIHWLSQDPHIKPTSLTVSDLQHIRVPVTAIVGQHDLAEFRHMTSLIASYVTCAKRIVVPAVGHLVSLEAPGTVNNVIADLLINFSASAQH